MGLMSLFRRSPATSLRSCWRDLGTPDAVYAVGDVHGRRDLVEAMESKLAEDWASLGFDDVVVLYLGDIIDRGPSSAHVLDLIVAPPPPCARRVVLLGNHEDMFLSFLEHPVGHLEWLDQGGAETLASYGVYLTPNDLRRQSRRAIGQYLRASIPSSHLDVLRSAPRAATAGAWAFSHAGLDPDVSQSGQTALSLTWGIHGDLTTREECSGPLVFGHFASENVRRRGQTFCIDTGAYKSGRLSAIRILPGDASASPELFELSLPERPARP